MRHRCALAALCLAVLPAAGLRAADVPTTAPSDAAPVNLHRPFKPGTSYDVHYVYDEGTMVTYSGAVTKKDPTDTSMQLDLTGRISDAVADKDGNCQQFTLVIKHLLSKGHDSIRPGSVITVMFAKDFAGTSVRFEAAAKTPAVPDNAVPLLFKVFNPFYADGVRMDHAFGTTAPQPLDTAWKPAPAGIVDFLSDEKTVSVAPFNTTCTAKLTNADDPAHKGARRLTAHVDCKDASLAEANRLVNVESSSATYDLSVRIPADPDGPLLEQEHKFELVADFTTITGRAKAKETHHFTLKSTVAVVKPAGVSSASAAPADAGVGH